MATRAFPCDIAIVGAGPAGLFAAEALAGRGFSVIVFEKLASPARKFMMAGRGGLNLTHSEDFEGLLARYGARAGLMRPILEAFPPAALRAWADGLGAETFVGTSGRVFPRAMKASPLLRAWLRRLDSLGVRIETRQRWTGFDADGRPTFESPAGSAAAHCRATLLALGGASWPRLGSDGAWVGPLEASGAEIAPLRPANCGVEIGWSEHMREKGAGLPLKRIAISGGGRTAKGEATITCEGLEGGAVYAILDGLREEIARTGSAALTIDLRPDRNLEGLEHDLSRVPAAQSTANRLRKGGRLDSAAALLLNEAARPLPRASGPLARLVKAVPLTATGVRPIERAISTAGGVMFEALDENLMLKARPGLFLAGEMLDWEAPTGGYLLQGCFATAKRAADGAAAWLDAGGR